VTHRARFAGVANDPGGARAILPVLELLQKRGHAVKFLAAGPAIAIAEGEFSSIPRVVLRDRASLAQCLEVLRRPPVEALLSAAGAYNLLEHTARRAAQKIGIPVVAVLDSWWFYRERFERIVRGGQRQTSWPDHICAIDAKTQRDLLALGVGPERVTVTGAPHLERTLQRTRQAARKVKTVRRRLGLGATIPCAVFFSEPSRRPGKKSVETIKRVVAARGEPAGLGCDPVAIVALVASAIERECAKGGKVALIVKPHPAEDPAELRRWATSQNHRSVEVIVATDPGPAELFAVGDVFFGLTSITLLEASLTGKMVVSVQAVSGKPRSWLAKYDCCVSNQIGLSEAVYSRGDLQKFVRLWLRGKRLAPKNRHMPVIKNATRNVARVMERLSLGGGSRKFGDDLQSCPG